MVGCVGKQTAPTYVAVTKMKFFRTSNDKGHSGKTHKKTTEKYCTQIQFYAFWGIQKMIFYLWEHHWFWIGFAHEYNKNDEKKKAQKFPVRKKSWVKIKKIHQFISSSYFTFLPTVLFRWPLKHQFLELFHRPNVLQTFKRCTSLKSNQILKIVR